LLAIAVCQALRCPLNDRHRQQAGSYKECAHPGCFFMWFAAAVKPQSMLTQVYANNRPQKITLTHNPMENSA